MVAVADLQGTVVSVAETAGASVVGISDHAGAGSGVVIADGIVLTNAHNIRRDGVRVTFADGRVAEGTVAGADVDGDIAVVKVDTGGTRPIEWSDAASRAGIGAPVLALSNPGGGGLRVTFGLVSGTSRAFRGPRGRRIGGAIEHTAPLLPGSSGGPVVDPEGRLLGINTLRLGEGFYLAIPADDSLKRRAESLGRGERPARPRLGVGVAPAHVARGLRRAVGLPEAQGLLVRQVEADGPAARAGIGEGDLIVSAGGRDLATADDLYEALAATAPGGALELRVLRGAEERSVSVVPES